MTQTINKDNLEIDSRIYDLVVNEILPETGIGEDSFWSSFQRILEEFTPINKALLTTRDDLQSQIDAWHIRHKDVDHDPAKYKQFLKDINYIVDDDDKDNDFNISTKNVDPEIKTIAGPQLVVPINNARFSLNATNARWGSLFDAIYGTDVIPNEGELTKGKKHNPKRGAKVVKVANEFLDSVLPLTEGNHGMVSAYSLIDSGGRKVLQIILDNGHIAELKNTDSLIGYTEDDASAYSLLFKNNGLHIEIKIDPCSLIGKTMLSGIKDIILESALTTIQDCEDSVTAVDAEDKVTVYKNWLGLMKGNLEQHFEKNGKTLKRQLNTDREFIGINGEAIKLSGRSLLLVRNVGHLMTIDAVKFNGKNIPEGILDGMITALAFMHDYKGNSPYKNSASNSMYIVKPKMHGPDEVRFTVDLFSRIEEALGLPKNTLKVGIMDEERRTTVNLKSCIRQAKERLIFINTGFLDRTGDEIHTSMEAGAFLPKAEMKTQPWIKAYEDWNVDIGIQCGLPGKAQIGKGMWAMPDLMADMLKDKIQHPLAGANCAWVPSPTAATLHVMHYHQVNVAHVQNELAHRVPASLDEILTIPLMLGSLPKDQITSELRDNAQSILGYVVRWIDHGVGCSKVPDTHNVALMEDRATLRISSQLIANWLHHNLCSTDEIISAFKEMAVVVDEQNAQDPFYKPMAPNFDGIAFKTAIDLALKGREQPSGYTEPLLHAYRIKQKQH